MAITHEYDSSFGMPLPDAYVRVREIAGDGQRLVATAHVYATKEARDAGAEPVAIHTLAFKPDLTAKAKNFIAQAYAAFKADQAFDGATDC